MIIFFFTIPQSLLLIGVGFAQNMSELVRTCPDLTDADE
jgi:hypothetical protein